MAAISWGELERPAHAHPLAPSLLELKELEPERFAVRFKKSLLRPAGVDVRPVLPDSCQGIGEPALSRDASSAILDWEVECPGGLVGETLRVEGLAESRTDALVRVAMSDGRVVQAVLDGSGAGLEVPARQGRFQVFVDYLDLGFEHILTGVDHLLFVLGLVLLVHGWRSLLTTVTSFTVGHSVTLSLAVLGYVEFPSRLVEVAIAFSIYWLAIELVRDESGRPSALGRRPWLMAGSFGLLHGFGFAGALSEVGLPAEEVPMALLSFNVGIEFGQLAFVVCVLLVSALAKPLRSRIPSALEQLPAYGIGSLAFYWFLERLASLR
ncbi:HupE/UreJ family protein [Myxococcota bacterium]|nr:HupE/UreJ family protein [Myxococcota bacterium]